MKQVVQMNEKTQEKRESQGKGGEKDSEYTVMLHGRLITFDFSSETVETKNGNEVTYLKY